jgi:predicted small lipoprotein YifL
VSRSRLAAASLMAALLLGGCGQKGQLYLPKKTKVPPPPQQQAPTTPQQQPPAPVSAPQA